MRFSKMVVLGLVIIGLLAGNAMAAITTRNTGASTTGITWGIPYESLSPTTFTTTNVVDTGVFYVTPPATTTVDLYVTFGSDVLIGSATGFYKLGVLGVADTTAITSDGTVMPTGGGIAAAPIEVPANTAGTLGVVTGNQIKFTGVAFVQGKKYIVVDAANNAVITAGDTVNSLGMKLAIPSSADANVTVGSTFSVTTSFQVGTTVVSTTTQVFAKYVMSQTYTVTGLQKTILVSEGRLKLGTAGGAAGSGTLTDTIVVAPTSTSTTNPFMFTAPAVGTEIASLIYTVSGVNQAAISTVKESIGGTTLTFASGAWTYSQSSGAFASETFTFTVTGTTVINTGSFSVGITGTGGSGHPAALTYLASSSAGSWVTDGYQGVVAYMSANSAFTTICFLSNPTTAAANVFLDILAAESGAALTGLTNLSVGSIAAGGLMRVDFNANVTPYSFTGGAEVAGTAIPLTGLNAADRYVARFTITAAKTSIVTNCIQLDPAGAKRAVPVMNPFPGNYFQQ